jgi:hypothetical protein
LSRFDFNDLSVAIDPVPAELPAINWASIGKQGPKPTATTSRAPADPLPEADIVVITWTDSEWSALDHVFANSNTTRANGIGSWSNDWHQYGRNIGQFSTTGRNAESLWGKFRVVTVPGQSKTWNVILFHSAAHLQYAPGAAGLRAMVGTILEDAKPSYLYSIGTAGGAALDQALGDPVVTNGAQLEVKSSPDNGKTFACAGWYPKSNLFADAQKLMLKLSQFVTTADLQMLFSTMKSTVDVGSINLSDLTSKPLQPSNLGNPTIHSLQGTPLNTSTDFMMAPGQGTKAYAAYEEDDAIVGQAALVANVNFVFVRNISDPVVPDQTAAGAAIGTEIRKKWAGAIYDRYGLITSTNGALAAWAAIAAS